jgi:conjugal transfer pilus assembly protein TraD
VRLFGRGRSAGMSLLLGPQELADLALAANPNLKDQVLGNLTTPIAHRQLIPDSAEQIAAIAGTQGTWVTSTVPSPSSLTSRPWSSPGG